jgi:probable F420-dependent oxidoreductase
MKPFRFGIEIDKLPPSTWEDDLRFIEDIGYSSILWTDHFGPQWEPTSAMATTAAVTERLKTGTMVYCVDYHHPAVLAKASATVHLLSGGRIELGMGAGWLKADYDQAGIPYDKPSTRIRRLEEAIQVIKSMWKGKTTFHGKHYHITDIFRAIDLRGLDPPPVLVGGGGRMILSMAGRQADIVSIIPSIPEGRFTRNFINQGYMEFWKNKVKWVKDSALKAGREPDDIEFSVSTFHTEITDDPEPVYERLARRWGIPAADAKRIPVFFVGSADDVKEQLLSFREETGINYIVVGLPDVDEIRQFGEHVVKELAGI